MSNFKIKDGVLMEYFPEEGETSVILPEGVTAIADGAFHRCSSLTSITIPDSVTRIGEAAFFVDKNLKRIYAPHISPDLLDNYNTFMWAQHGSPNYALAALVCGFAELDRQGDKRCEEKRHEYIKYARWEWQDFIWDSGGDPELLRFFLKYIGISDAQAELFHWCAAKRGNEETELLLQEYKRKHNQ